MRSHALRAAAGLNKASNATATYQGTTNSTSANTAYSFPSTTIGGNGIVVVVAQVETNIGNSGNLASATIAGIPATIAIQDQQDTCSITIFYVEYSGGSSTETIALNYDDTQNRCIISVYRLQNHNTLEPQEVDSIGGTGSSLSRTPTKNGTVITGITHDDQTTTVAWLGVTERYDTGVGTTRASGASNDDFVGGTIITATFTVSDSSVLAYTLWQ